MRDQHTPGIDSAQYEREAKANQTILLLQRKVDQLNIDIETIRAQGYQVRCSVLYGESADMNKGQFSVAIELPEGVENIRG